MRISRTLVTAEIAMSLVLLTGAGLLLKSFWHLAWTVHPGFESHHIVTTKLWLPVAERPGNGSLTGRSRSERRF